MARRYKVQKVKGVTPDMTFDYKDVETLRRFITPRGKIMGRSQSSLSSSQQRELTRAIKRARMLALLPYAN